MKRLTLLLTALGMVLLVVVFFLFLFQPAREELALVEEQIDQELDEQLALQGEIDRLRSVREEAPQVEAGLATADAILPRDPGLPALVRHLQLAADESGIALITVSTSRPTELADMETEGLSSLAVTTQLEGGYFQVVDFLRRIEDPAITPRGVTWSTATVSRADDLYPDLTVSLTGDAYAIIPGAVEPEPEPAPDDPDDDADEVDATTEAEIDGEEQS